MRRTDHPTPLFDTANLWAENQYPSFRDSIGVIYGTLHRFTLSAKNRRPTDSN
jgi:hypothetical protein